MILYPVKAGHTRPIVCGAARSIARSHVHSDIANDAEVTPTRVISEAERAFKGFCKGQSIETLTDNYTALQAMYINAYVLEYWKEYRRVMRSLKRLIKQSVINWVLRMIRIAM